MKNFFKKIFGIKSVEKPDSDIGKCTKCRFNVDDNCIVGTHYAKQGKNRFCIEGELWEPRNK